jgi:hypothetical protein
MPNDEQSGEIVPTRYWQTASRYKYPFVGVRKNRSIQLT